MYQCKYMTENGRCKRVGNIIYCWQHEKIICFKGGIKEIEKKYPLFKVPKPKAIGYKKYPVSKKAKIKDIDLKKQELFKELKSQGISSKTLDAMKKIPREKFVPVGQRFLAYRNSPLSIGEGQTISQPYIVGHMIDVLDVNKTSNVLEIGTGSGYNLAVLSKLSKHVTSVERIKNLLDKSKKVLSDLGIKNITIVLGDGTKGYELNSPYDRIIVTAGAKDIVPPPLISQLKEEGIIVIPKKYKGEEWLFRGTKQNGELKMEQITPVRFVPLVGEFGY